MDEQVKAVQKIQEYIENHLCEDISLTEVAKTWHNVMKTRGWFKIICAPVRKVVIKNFLCLKFKWMESLDYTHY